MGFLAQIFFLALEGLGIASIKKVKNPYRKTQLILLYLLTGLMLVVLFFMIFGAAQ